VQRAGENPGEHGTPVGRLWRYDPDGSLHMMVPEGILCGNGVSWSPDNRTSESKRKEMGHTLGLGAD
jgi:sugar lactone lactonase YvrE